jgi:hypothetical protein
MKKRSLLLGFVAAAIAAFILSGCESPTGSNGSPGRDGPGLALPGQEITPELLEAWFKATSTVILPAYTAGKTTISGEVPADKTLVITGGEFVLKYKTETIDGATTFPAALTVKGTLELQEGSVLNAGYYVTVEEGERVTHGVGWLELAEGGSLTGTGTVELPYIVVPNTAGTDGTSTVPVGIAHYDGVSGVNRLPVSYIAAAENASAPVSALKHGGLDKIFELLEAPDVTPTVFTTSIKTILENVLEDDVAHEALPAGRKLTLTGGGSTIDGTVAGELVVTGTLAKLSDGAIGISLPAGGKLHVDVGGKLTVESLDLTGETATGAGALVVDGTLVASDVVTGGVVKSLPEPEPEPEPDPNPPAGESVNRLKSEYPSVDSPNILIGESGVLELVSDGTIEGTITNNGVIKSASDDADKVTPLLKLPAGTGKVVLSGDNVSLGSAALALTQNIEITGKVSAPTAPSGTTEAFVPFTGEKTITIDQNGKLALGDAENIETGSFAGTAVIIVNNGAITTTSLISTTLENVINAVSGITGTIALEFEDTLEVTSRFEVPAGLSVAGNIEVKSGGQFIAPDVPTPFVNDTVININGGILSLAAANVSFDGITISNKGTITTPETDGAKLNNILALGGKVSITSTSASVTTATLSNDVTVPDGVTLGIVTPVTTLTVAGTVTVKAGGELAAAPSFDATGKVVFEYGAKGTGIGVAPGYNWLASAPYSKITLTSGSTELTAGALSYDGSDGTTAGLTVAEGAALTVNGSLTVTNVVALAGTVTVKSGGTLISSVVGNSGFIGRIVFEKGSTGKLDATTTLIGASGYYQWSTGVNAKVTLQGGQLTTLSGGVFSYNGGTSGSIANTVIVDPDAILTVGDSAGLSGVLGVYGTLDIPAGKTLTVATSGILRVNGAATVKGALDVETGGAIAVSGTVTVKYGGAYKYADADSLTGTGEVVLEYKSTATTDTTGIAGQGSAYIYDWSVLAPYSKVALAKGNKPGPDTILDYTGPAVFNGDIVLASGANLTFKDKVTVTGTFTVSDGATLVLPSNPADVGYGEGPPYTGEIVLTKGANAYYGAKGIIGSGDAYYLNWDTTVSETDSALTLKGGSETELSSGKVIAVKDTQIADNNKLVIADGGTLTISDGVTFTLEGALDVVAKGEIVVASGGVFTVAANNDGGDLNGTITVKDGGISYDLKSGGGSLWTLDSEGQYVFEAGAKAYVGGDEKTQANYWIGPDIGIATELPIIALTGGTFTNSKTEYTLAGNATVRGSLGLTSETVFKVAENSTLTVELKWKGVGAPVTGPYGAYISGNAKFVGEADTSQIVVKTPAAESITGGFIYISNETGQDKGAGKNFYSFGNEDTLISNDATTIGGQTYTGVPVGGYAWNASLGNNAGGWKAVDVTAKYALLAKESSVDVRGQPYLLDSKAEEEIVDGKPVITVTLTSKSGAASPYSSDTGGLDPLWGTVGNNAPNWGWADVTIDGSVLLDGLSNTVVSWKSTNQAYRYYAGNTFNASAELGYPINTNEGSIYIPSAARDFPMRWKVYPQNEFNSDPTVTVLLGSGAEKDEQIVTIQVYKHEGFTDPAAVTAKQGVDDGRTHIATLKIDYSGVTAPASGD